MGRLRTVVASVAVAALMLGGVALAGQDDAGAPPGVERQSSDSASATPGNHEATAPPTRTARPQEGLWLCADHLASLPTSGTAWRSLKAAADGKLGKAKIKKQDSNHDTNTLAAALVYARTGDRKYGKKARDGIASAIGTEEGGRTLALARNLPSYVIAADVMRLRSFDPALDRTFRAWLRRMRTTRLDGSTLEATHETRPNNWGTHAGAARVAASAYLGDRDDLDRAALVFRGYLGDRRAYAKFAFGDDLSWQADPSRPVGINPPGASLEGRDVDGALPEELRRNGSFSWPPPKVNYVWGALDGATVQAELLHRLGYPAWEWGDQAIRRAYGWLHDVNRFPATSDNTWQPWVVNHAYGTSYPAPTPAAQGKGMAWTDWTHAGSSAEDACPANS